MADTASGPRTATASVLFADVVGSTELRSRLGEDAADALRRELDATLAEVVGRRGGRVVKGLGDGVLAVFDAATDAVGAGVDMQQAAPAQVSLRIGVSTGDVSFEAGDVFGLPVVEASRLCGTATEGQILVAELVRALARGRGAYVFEPVGELELKGLSDPVAACRVRWERPIGTTRGRIPLPGLLTMGAQLPYVGRPELLERLATAWRDVTGGGGSACLLLAGEPGVGKTRTSAQVAQLAHDSGGLVLYGSCEEGLAVPFQPFVEALEFHSAHDPELRLGRLPGELRRLLPELAARVPDLPPAVVSDPATEEYRLFEAASSWLIDASRGSGLLLVLDDLHWATRGTLLVLLHALKCASADPAARLLIVGTYRDTEVDRVHPLSAVLADLRRLPEVDRLSLSGLSRDEVVSFAEAAAGHELDADGHELAHLVFAETAGNPFFMGEVFRHLVETGQLRLVDGRWGMAEPGRVDVPEGVRDVIGRRLGRLSEATNQVLGAAAVIGREFDLELAGWVVDLDESTVLDAVDDACRARLVEELGPDRFRFAHAMVRETLYGELSPTRRRRLHRTVTEVMAKIRPHDVAALAHHAVEAGPVGGDVTAAVSYLIAAADQALGSRAFADAEVFYRKVLELLDESGAPENRVRVEALCGLGEVQRDRGQEGYRETLLQAGWAALDLGLVDLAARAARANFRGTASLVCAGDRERVAVLAAVLEALGAERSARAAMVLATLAAELLFDPTMADRRVELAARAVAIAAENADPHAEVAVAVRCFAASYTPERWAATPAHHAGLTAKADATGDPTLRVLARVWLACAHFGVGNVDRGRHLLGEAVEIAEVDCPPFVRLVAGWWSVQFLVYQGDLVAAERANLQFAELGESVGWADVDLWCGACQTMIERSRGRDGFGAEMAELLADTYSEHPAWRVQQAAQLAQSGRLDEAADTIRRYGLGRAAAVPADNLFFSVWFALSHAALLVEDAELGALAERELRPYEPLWSHCFMWVDGPVRWILARALGAQRRWPEADAMYAAAETDLMERDLRPLRLLLVLDRVRTLLASDDPASSDRAHALGHEARADARRRGLDPLVAVFDQLLA
jgi:class 3 adenylate cyclase